MRPGTIIAMLCVAGGLALAGGSCEQADEARCQLDEDCASGYCCKLGNLTGSAQVSDDGICLADEAACRARFGTDAATDDARDDAARDDTADAADADDDAEPADVPADLPEETPGDVPADLPEETPADVPEDLPADAPGDAADA